MSIPRSLGRAVAVCGIFAGAAACQPADGEEPTTTTVALGSGDTATTIAAIAAPVNDSKGFDDVTVTECYVEDSFGVYAGARGSITNPSSKASNYMISVRFMAGGVQISTGTALANSVLPGGTALFDTGGLNAVPDGTDPAGVTCEKADVTRFAS